MKPLANCPFCHHEFTNGKCCQADFKQFSNQNNVTIYGFYFKNYRIVVNYLQNDTVIYSRYDDGTTANQILLTKQAVDFESFDPDYLSAKIKFLLTFQ